MVTLPASTNSLISRFRTDTLLETSTRISQAGIIRLRAAGSVCIRSKRFSTICPSSSVLRPAASVRYTIVSR